MRAEVVVKVYSASDPQSYVVDLPEKGVVKVCDGIHIRIGQGAPLYPGWANPKRGMAFRHIDGGLIFVVGRKPKMVHIQRHVFGDSQAEPRWIRLSTFEAIAADLQEGR